MYKDEDYGKDWPLADQTHPCVGLNKIPRLPKKLSIIIDDFLASCIKRNFKAAEDSLALVRQAVPTRNKLAEEFYEGLLNALNGILFGLRTKDLKLLINNIDEAQLQEFKKFLKPIHPKFEQGYFFIMIRYLKFMRKVRKHA